MQGYRWLWLLLLCAPLALGQSIYKWTDANGEVHYGEEAPEGSKASEVTVRPDLPSGNMPPAQGHDETMTRMQRNFDEDRAKQEEADSRKAMEKAARKKNCIEARDRLRSYKDAGSLYDLDKNGERRTLNDAEHAAALKHAEEEVAAWCK